MKLTAIIIAVAMVCMTLEGCDTQTAYDSRVVMKELEGGLARANQAFIEGFADRPAQIITIDYKPERERGQSMMYTVQRDAAPVSTSH